MAEIASPERRSAADLLHLLDGLIPPDGTILSSDLPRVIHAFEQRRAIQLLLPAEKAELVGFCETNGDLEVTQHMLYGFLSTITKATAPEPSSPTPSPAAATKRPGHRRRSDRIRSPSSGSDTASSSEGEQPSASISFPTSSYPSPPPSTPQTSHPWPVKRSLTLSDPSRVHGESPLAARARSGVPLPPSSFQRPPPKGRRGRTSSEGASFQGDEDTSYREQTPPSFRTGSINSNGRRRDRVSSNNSQLGYMSSPIQSPGGALDEGSFHGASFGLEPDQLDGSDTALDPRLSRIATDSASSLRTSHDQLSALQKQNSELARKVREAEQKLLDLGAENEILIGDLQDRLEEARNEISTRRREDKEMKGKERAQLIQIANFESDIAALQRSLESSKASYTNMQRLYNDQCAETQRLRDVLRGRDAEISESEQATQAHEADHAKWDTERQALEAAAKRLESDLATARSAETALETQKQQNLELKETIDRLKFDLDEARAIAAGHTRPSISSAPGTMSRNLGDEIARQMDALDEDEEEEENVTVVTTHRRRKIAPRDGKAYADAATATAPLPPYSAEPEPLQHDANVLARAHPETSATFSDDLDAEEQYQAVAAALGVKCTVLESRLESTRAVRIKRAGSVKAHRNGDISTRTKIINYIFLNEPGGIAANAAPLAAWSIAMLAIGIFLSPAFPAVFCGMNARDDQLFLRMNTIALAAGAGEGFSTGRGVLGIVGDTARMVAGRVPI